MVRLLMMAALLLEGSAFAAERCTPDRDVHVAAAGGGLPEMQTGELAQDRGASPPVRGTMMVRDQALANERLKGIAVRTDITSPAEPGAKRKATTLELAAGQIRW